ncbi:hypothetical protein BDR04DRAFT_1157748 [Suillus decipiens]|nr:hypothetical protein BDR04DRAFT_1157748 [Suillus decipiens]
MGIWFASDWDVDRKEVLEGSAFDFAEVQRVDEELVPAAIEDKIMYTKFEFVGEIGKDTPGARRPLEIINDVYDVNDAEDFLFPHRSRNVFNAPSYLHEISSSTNLMMSYSTCCQETMEADQAPPHAPEQTIDYLAMLTHPNTPLWTVNRRHFPLRPAYTTTFNGFDTDAPCSTFTLMYLRMVSVQGVVGTAK